MARGVLESRGLTAAGSEVWEEDEPMLLPMPGSLAVRRHGRQVWVLGALAVGVLVLVGLGSIAHPPLTIARRTIGTEWESKVAVKPSKGMHTFTPDAQIDKSNLKVADDTKAQEEIIVEDDNDTVFSAAAQEDLPLAINGPPVAGKPGKLDIANREVQELIDAMKVHVPSLLKPQGWNVGLGSFKALTYCKQDVAGLNYVVKVQVADDKVSKVARAGEVLQMTINKLLGKAPVLTSVQMVARDDRRCFATPLTPPPALPHVVFDATPKVQALCDAVKGEVPKLLKTSGWNLNLAPYQALSYCGDGVNHIVKVKVADGEALLSEYPDGLFLQLLLRVPEGKDIEEASLMGALMVAPVDKTCASLPVLPSPAHMKAQLSEGVASALKPKSVTDALTHAPKPPTSKAPPEPDEKALDDEREESDKAGQQPKENNIPEPKPQGKESLEPQLQTEMTELQPQKKEATEPKPNKKDITEPKPKETESLEPKQQETELAEQKPQEKTATEPKPQQKETAELKPHEKKATEPKTQKKETVEQKPQEKEVTEPLEEKETSTPKTHTKVLPEHESGVAGRNDEHER